MKNTFSYNAGKRLFGLIFCIVVILMTCIFFRGFLQSEDMITSAMCLLICMIGTTLAIFVWNESQLKIIINQNSVRVKRLYNSIVFDLNEVIEYGRDNYHTRTSYDWRYYVILIRDQNKKITIFYDGLSEIKVISAYIIAKSNSAKLVNIGPGRI
jgi:hypothetical protein